ncbi:MAG: glycosyl transferase family 1 [Gammaproteobacteria bacterium]|nr:MAG: glycosyl transferase family 1 [Gammaproteobacteria bacterium]
MKIAILGTRGIPNNYGGFEQFAEYLALGLVKKGHDVTVYNSHSHPYQNDVWRDVKIRHIYDPEKTIGTAGQFVYDFLSILDTRTKKFDVILELGYTSSSVFFCFHPKKSVVITNMDGLEWKRAKYSHRVQKYLLWAEALAAKKSDFLVSDSMGIQDYIKEKYGLDSRYIPYGAHLFDGENDGVLVEYGLQPYKYNMLIARLEPENSIEIILDGVVKGKSEVPFLVIGNNETKFGMYLKEKYTNVKEVVFVGGIYEIETLNNLRFFSNLYFHGHTVGGTNPSLLEAMASSSLICAHANTFNSTILEDDAFFFSSVDDVATVLKNVNKIEHDAKLVANRAKIMELYSWDKITAAYEKLFMDALDCPAV